MGDTEFSEYSKITARDDLAQKVWLQNNSKTLEVSDNHWLLCIEPIMYGIWIENNEWTQDKEIRPFTMYLGGTIARDRNSVHQPEAILILELFDRIDQVDGTLFLLRLQSTRLYQLDFLRRYLLYFRYYRKGGLTLSRFKEFVSSYSYPRRIRIVSFRKDNYLNIFPMDLLGDIGRQKRYVFGLRHTNVALQMILETGKLVVAEVPREFKNTVYELGKHHSSSPPSPDDLSFKVIETKTFRFFVPEWVESYKEVRIIRTINMGSHMLLWGEIVSEERLKGSSEHLFLVHFLHYLHQKNKGYEYQLV